jgi:hypothetical protein
MVLQHVIVQLVVVLEAPSARTPAAWQLQSTSFFFLSSTGEL